ncbi:protein kinase domain-containing protein [Mycobacteroides abscessus]|uniref:protein kinase domain-containing protein n=1 Tax=Mycobacteroides abscessus TaxID=36809 RepID=UPI000C25ED71|nr:protein kinase [Mycobacteroides abscessus]
MGGAPGRIGPYRVLSRLGGGASGDVFLVQHPRLPRREALKLLNGPVSRDDSFRGRFDREASLLAQLQHRNIVIAHDRGQWNGQLWLTMEYLAGGDAGQLLKDRGPLSVAMAVQIVSEVGAALDDAYTDIGIMHRDVKPANILLDFHPSDGQLRTIKLADFGLAKAVAESTSLTCTGTALGTLAYISPEAFQMQPVDNRADLYSLACTAFRLLTGELPFPAATASQFMAAHLVEPVPAIVKRRPDLPVYLNAVFDKALAKNPADRYQTAGEFSEALRGPRKSSTPNLVQRLEPATATILPAHTGQFPTLPTAAQPPTRKDITPFSGGQTSRNSQRRATQMRLKPKNFWIPVLAVVLLAATAGTMALLNGQRVNQQQATAPSGRLITITQSADAPQPILNADPGRISPGIQIGAPHADRTWWCTAGFIVRTANAQPALLSSGRCQISGGQATRADGTAIGTYRESIYDGPALIQLDPGIGYTTTILGPRTPTISEVSPGSELTGGRQGNLPLQLCMAGATSGTICGHITEATDTDLVIAIPRPISGADWGAPIYAQWPDGTITAAAIAQQGIDLPDKTQAVRASLIAPWMHTWNLTLG